MKEIPNATLLVWKHNEGDHLGYAYVFKTWSASGRSPATYSEILAVRRQLSNRLTETIQKHKESATEELRQAINDVMVNDGAKLAGALFERQDFQMIHNIASAADYTQIVEGSDIRLPYEMVCLPHREVIDGPSIPSFLGDLTVLIRSPAKKTTPTAAGVFESTKISATRFLSVVGPDVPVNQGAQTVEFAEFEHIDDLFKEAHGKELFFVVAHFNHKKDDPGIRLAKKGGDYTRDSATVRRFPKHSLIFLLACRSHAEGIANAITDESDATVLGASTDIVTADTLRMAKDAADLVRGKDRMTLVDFARQWNEGEDRIFKRLLALRGNINIVLERD